MTASGIVAVIIFVTKASVSVVAIIKMLFVKIQAKFPELLTEKIGDKLSPVRSVPFFSVSWMRWCLSKKHGRAHKYSH